jgi:hypothetical protein
MKESRTSLKSKTHRSYKRQNLLISCRPLMSIELIVEVEVSSPGYGGTRPGLSGGPKIEFLVHSAPYPSSLLVVLF